MNFFYNDDNSGVMHCKHENWITVKWYLILISVNKYGSHRDDYSGNTINIPWTINYLRSPVGFLNPSIYPPNMLVSKHWTSHFLKLHDLDKEKIMDILV
jgi:hypothetical protein